jgi:hypothetical protein
VNEPLLAEKLAEVAAVAGDADGSLRAFDIFLRIAGDDAVVRINPAFAKHMVSRPEE